MKMIEKSKMSLLATVLILAFAISSVSAVPSYKTEYEEHKPLTCASCTEYWLFRGTELVKCPIEKPFCSQSVLGDYCSTIPTCPIEPIYCTSIGVFPDPFNCQNYHNCSAANEDSVPSKCETGFVYNAATSKCVKKVREADCVTVKCDSTKFWSRFGTSTKFYARCYEKDDESTAEMYKCSDGTTFDGNTCNLSCNKVTKIPDTNSNNRYFSCVKAAVGTGYTYTLETCEDDFVFNAKTLDCEAIPAS